MPSSAQFFEVQLLKSLLFAPTCRPAVPLYAHTPPSVPLDFKKTFFGRWVARRRCPWRSLLFAPLPRVLFRNASRLARYRKEFMNAYPGTSRCAFCAHCRCDGTFRRKRGFTRVMTHDFLWTVKHFGVRLYRTNIPKKIVICIPCCPVQLPLS